MYSLLTEPPGDTPAPSGWVSLQSKERVQRIVMWMNQNFLLNEEIEVEYCVFKMLEVRTFFSKIQAKNELDMSFLSLRDNSILSLSMDAQGVVTVKTDDMDLAGDIVQSLGTYLGMEDLATSCNFPTEISGLEKMLSSAEELQSVRQRLSADMADHSGVIRSLVVRSEDSRIMGDMKSLR